MRAHRSLLTEFTATALLVSLLGGPVWAGRIPPDLQSTNVLETSEDGTVPILKGTVQVDQDFVPDVTFAAPFELNKGEKLTLIMMDMIATGYNQPGDMFDARVKLPVTRQGHVLIPQGVLVRGHLLQTADPGKAFHQNGKLVLAFDTIIMPDGRHIPFKSSYQKGDSSLKAVGRAVGSGLGGTLSGAVQGALVGLKYAGYAGVVATHGATLIGGGGLGAFVGLGQGLSKTGSDVLLNEGDEIQVALQEPLQLPAINMPPEKSLEIQAPGLSVSVTKYSLGRDPFKVANQINLDLKIDNQTDYNFGSLDMVLMDEYEHVYQLSPFGNADMMSLQISPHAKTIGQATFGVECPELKHYLIFYKPYTREILARIPLSQALKALSLNSKGKNKNT